MLYCFGERFQMIKKIIILLPSPTLKIIFLHWKMSLWVTVSRPLQLKSVLYPDTPPGGSVGHTLQPPLLHYHRPDQPEWTWINLNVIFDNCTELVSFFISWSFFFSSHIKSQASFDDDYSCVLIYRAPFIHSGRRTGPCLENLCKSSGWSPQIDG